MHCSQSVLDAFMSGGGSERRPCNQTQEALALKKGVPKLISRFYFHQLYINTSVLSKFSCKSIDGAAAWDLRYDESYGYCEDISLGC